MTNFQLDAVGIKFIQQRESPNGVPELEAYQDQAGIWTIGWGFTHYADGRRVKQGDIITPEMALPIFMQILNPYVNTVNHSVDSKITQNMFNALVDFTYNEGQGALIQSTLLKKVNVDPKDLLIKDEFQKWDKIKIDGQYQVNQGLLNRRNLEWELYIS